VGVLNVLGNLCIALCIQYSTKLAKKNAPPNHKVSSRLFVNVISCRHLVDFLVDYKAISGLLAVGPRESGAIAPNRDDGQIMIIKPKNRVGCCEGARTANWEQVIRGKNI
jgi:hypothetical protein